VQSSVTVTLGDQRRAPATHRRRSDKRHRHALPNHLAWNGAANTLNGSGGNDVLQGSGGNDTVTDTSGNNVLDGGDGRQLNGGTGREFVAGGAGKRRAELGGRRDIIAFQSWHGRGLGRGADLRRADSARPTDTADARLAFATPILAPGALGQRIFRQGWRGTADSIKFHRLVLGSGNRTVASLQLIVDSTADSNAGCRSSRQSTRGAVELSPRWSNAFDSAYAPVRRSED